MGKTKGAAALTSVKLLRGRKDEARKVLPLELHHYLEERIVVASWYPERDVFGLMMGVAKLFPLEGGQFEAMGAAAARLHLDGLYAPLLQRDPAVRARTLWKTQHDSGELVLTNLTEDSATYELNGWEQLGAEHCRLLGGYFCEVHRLTGAAEPSYEHTACSGRGGALCTWVVRWKTA
jgi:hypothetical protein